MTRFIGTVLAVAVLTCDTMALETRVALEPEYDGVLATPYWIEETGDAIEGGWVLCHAP